MSGESIVLYIDGDEVDLNSALWSAVAGEIYLRAELLRTARRISAQRISAQPG